jgi:sugar lactone lactonase YvrE
MKMPATQAEVIQLKGGLDQVTPTLGLKAGVCKQASNFECSVYGGYSRIQGYERYDGRPAPSAALGTIVFLNPMLVVPAIGATLETVQPPADVDFGVVEFAGPSETPYSLPSPNPAVSYETVTDAYGNEFLKEITATYSLRTVVNVGNLTDASYTGNSLLVSGQSNSPFNVIFKPDGLSMFMADGQNRSVRQYALSTAFDISTATYSKTSGSLYSATADGLGLVSANGVDISDDGTQIYVAGTYNSTPAIFQFSLSTAWDVSTRSTYSTKRVEIFPPANVVYGATMSADGTKMYCTSNLDKKVYQFNLSVAWDVSTAVYANKFVLIGAIGVTQNYGVDFSADGLRMYFADQVAHTVYRWVLSTAWDISTATASQSLSVNSQDATPRGICVNVAENLIYVTGVATLKIYEYAITGIPSYYLDVHTTWTYTPVTAASGIIAATGAGYVVVTKKTGTFTVGDYAAVGTTTIGTIVSSSGYTITPEQTAINSAAAADIYRADITAVPGSGAVRGVFLFEDVVYAFRDNAGGTAVDLYKSSTAGWVNVPYFYEVSFTAGTNEPAEGETLTQGGVTALIKRVATESGFLASTGAWVAGTAAGRFIIDAPAGGDFASGSATAGGSTTITLSGIQTSITFAVGGKFETVKTNFTGSAATNRVYGCDGANRAWEFDGEILTPISTGTPIDRPKHIESHSTCLFLTIGSSVIKSAPGWPFCYTAINLAAEFAIGEDVTGLTIGPGAQTTATLFIFSRSATSILYGSTTDDFQVVRYNAGIGAMDYSVQNMSDTIAMDDRGVVMLKTSLNYGNFDQATLTYNITPFINARRTRFSCSTLNRSKGQYRVFFSDGYGLYVTIVNGKWIGSMPVLFKTSAFCVTEDKFSSGEEACFFGGADGFVYHLDKGTSFDGENIYAYLVLNFAHGGNPRALKSYRRAAVEIQGSGYSAFRFGYSVGYGSSLHAQPSKTLYTPAIDVPLWGAFTWGEFTWGGRSISPSECSMDGTAENVATAFYSDSNYYQPFTINTVTLQYTNRRMMR